MSPRATKPAPARAPRQRKTDQQRAQERLGIEQRRVEGLVEKRDAAEAALTAAESDLERARARLAYAEADPALDTFETAGGDDA